jgi:hypothetical protein
MYIHLSPIFALSKMTIKYKLNVKTSAGIILIIVLSLFLLQINGWSRNKKVYLSDLTSSSDTIPSKKKRVKPVVKDTARATDTSSLSKDSLKSTIDTLHASKDSLDAPVSYTAKDSGVMIIPTKEFLLYGNSNMKHKDVVLDAGTIRYNSETEIIKAFGGTTDSTKNSLNKAQLVQGQMKSISDTISFSMKNLKGLTKNTYFNEGELYVNAEVLKKQTKDVFYAKSALITTCNLDTPHFAFRTKKVKLINGKYAYSGPAFPEFEGVPIPVAIPFGIFPCLRAGTPDCFHPLLPAMIPMVLGWKGWAFIK